VWLGAELEAKSPAVSRHFSGTAIALSKDAGRRRSPTRILLSATLSLRRPSATSCRSPVDRTCWILAVDVAADRISPSFLAYAFHRVGVMVAGAEVYQARPGGNVSHQSERLAHTRPVDPRCPICRSAKTRVTLRTEKALYLRCDACGHLWGRDKPQSRPPKADR